MLLQNHELKKPKFHAIIPSSKAVRNGATALRLLYWHFILSSPPQPDGHAPPGCFYAAQPALWQGRCVPRQRHSKGARPLCGPTPRHPAKAHTSHSLSFCPCVPGYLEHSTPPQHGGVFYCRKAAPMTNPRYANGALRRKHRARLKAMGAPCGICGGRLGPIHYDEPSDAAHPLSFVVDEIRPVARWREFGYASPRAAAEDWDNLQAAHYWCNAQKGCKLSLAKPGPAQLTGAQKPPADGSW